jgi:hypothetical protein
MLQLRNIHSVDSKPGACASRYAPNDPRKPHVTQKPKSLIEIYKLEREILITLTKIVFKPPVRSHSNVKIQTMKEKAINHNNGIQTPPLKHIQIITQQQIFADLKQKLNSRIRQSINRNLTRAIPKTRDTIPRKLYSTPLSTIHSYR